VYEKYLSGIENWSDGIAWSPSDTMGNFGAYHELKRPFSSDKANKAIERNENATSVSGGALASDQLEFDPLAGGV